MPDTRRIIFAFNLAIVLIVSWALFFYVTSVVGFEPSLFGGFAVSTGLLLVIFHATDRTVRTRRAQRAGQMGASDSGN